MKYIKFGAHTKLTPKNVLADLPFQTSVCDGFEFVQIPVVVARAGIAVKRQMQVITRTCSRKSSIELKKLICLIIFIF